MRNLTHCAGWLRGPRQRRRAASAAWLLWLFAGCIGLHRLYIGRYATAAAQLALFSLGVMAWQRFGQVAGLSLAPLAASLLWSLADARRLNALVRAHNRRLDAEAWG